LYQLEVDGGARKIRQVACSIMREMCAAAMAGNLARARAINYQLLGLHQKLFVGANPIPVKWVVQQMGLIGEGIRLPLTPLAEANEARVLAAMGQAGVIA
jgi:4-hydroxy-tetrahydrodipicolinate synthase